MKEPSGALVLNPLRPDAMGSLYRDLYAQLRRAVLSGRLAPGTRLPSTRTLAQDLGVSRTTTEEAYAQLEAEGYVVRRTGDGSYVADLPPRAALAPRRRAETPVRTRLSSRGALIAQSTACVETLDMRAFDGGVPPYDLFPIEVWMRQMARRARRDGHSLLGYGEPAGDPRLRAAVASYLQVSRGVVCVPEQVLILTSSQQALELAARLLTDPGDRACVEDPGYRGAVAALRGAGARVVPIPVDGDGLDISALCRVKDARLVYVTPSNQYPTGVTLSLERRLALLSWAARTGAYVLEDDYDSEFRYVGRPLAAIQGLDEAGRVLYVGTFTKVMFPSIRVAYLVLPRALVPAFAAARAQMDGHTARLTQATLADFIEEGPFGVHVRRMRQACVERRAVFLSAAQALPGGRAPLGAMEAGFRVILPLKSRALEADVTARGRKAGLDLPPLSVCGIQKAPAGLILGYTGLTPAAIRAAMPVLARLLLGRI